jgi:hypothetical protein
MIKKYISKFTIDILPSIVATIVGAYIVNHYIVPKSGDAPAAATASTVDPAKTASKPVADPPADVAIVPDAIPAKAKTADKTADKATEKSEKSAETATTPADTRRHQPTPRDKAVAKVTPAPVASPPVATASIAPASDAVPTAEERRDANDLARAAIERQRNSNDAQPRPQEAARAPEPVRTPEPPRVVAVPSMQPLPPAIMVSTPPVETYKSGQNAGAVRSPDAPREAVVDPRRPRPPGDIPLAQPMDLQADATATIRRDRTSMAEDVLSAAKSVFHSVLPRPFEH